MKQSNNRLVIPWLHVFETEETKSYQTSFTEISARMERDPHISKFSTRIKHFPGKFAYGNY